MRFKTVLLGLIITGFLTGCGAVDTDIDNDDKEEPTTETTTTSTTTSTTATTSITTTTSTTTLTTTTESTTLATTAETTTYTVPTIIVTTEYTTEPVVETTVIVTADISSTLPITADEREWLAEVVEHEAGSDWINTYDKACCVAVIMNRVADGRFGGSTIYSVLTAPHQFDGFYPGYCTPRQGAYEAVDDYFKHPEDFPASWYYWRGDGRQNYFY